MLFRGEIDDWQSVAAVPEFNGINMLAALAIGSHSVGDDAKALEAGRAVLKFEPRFARPDYVRSLPWSPAQKSALATVLAQVQNNL